MGSKKHFKMYKSGKLWVTAAVLGFSVMAGMTIDNQQVKADDQAPVAVTQTANAAETNNQTENAPGNTGTATNGQSGQATQPGNQDNQSQSQTTNETIHRQINYVNADGTGSYPSAQQTATVLKTVTGTTKTYDATGAHWSNVTLPMPKGMHATINEENVTVIPTDIKVVNGQPDITPIKVVFVKDMIKPSDNPTVDDLKNTDIYQVKTRTINITNTDGSITSKSQRVIFSRTKTQQPNGEYQYGDWKPAKAKWDAYKIPPVKGYVSKTVKDGRDDYLTAINAQDVNIDTANVTVNVTYVKAANTIKADTVKKDQPDYWKKVTRTVNYQLPAGTMPPLVQTVWFKRDNNAILKADGTTENHFTDWAADGEDTWDAYQFKQVGYYHTMINGQRVVDMPAVTVTPDTKDVTYTVTYVSDGTDPYNQQVKEGVHGNWASIDNIYMTDTGIHVTGWNANSDSYNRNYHFLIILDYGPNPVTGQFHEVGRKLVAGGINRPDVFRVHPVWNAATSGFDDTIDLDLSQIKAGDKLRILSRWTADPNGNYNPADLVSSYYTMDYATNVANLDGMAVTKDGQQLEVAGWNATNQVVGRKYHYIILRDATTGQEIGRQLVKDGIDRPDVAKVYPNLLSASKSGFNVKFNLSGIDLGHNLQVISRYSDTLGGEGSNVDYWFSARRLVSGTTTNFANLDGVNANGKTGKVTFAGWNANNFSQLEPNHYLILFDTTANKQVAAVKLDDKNGQVARPDVQKAYQTVNGALNSGFSYDIDMSQLIFGHTYALVSRYSTSADGNGGDGAYTDYWFNNAFAFNQQAYSVDKLELVAATKDAPKATQPTNGSKAQNAAAKAELKTDQQTDSKATDQQAGDKGTTKGDQQPVATPNQLHVAGWMASDGSGYKNAYVIVLDAKDSKHELGRSQVTLTKRDDVLKAFPTIYNVDQSGFDTTITLSDDAVKAAQADGVQLVLRYTDDKEGNGKLTADQWTTPFKYDQANNEFVKA